MIRAVSRAWVALSMVSHGDSKSRIKVELRGEGHPLSTTVTSQH